MPKRVYRYMYVNGDDPSVSYPMFVMGLERIYESDRETVCAIRVWHHIFDETHSTAGLMRRLMDENLELLSQQGIAHAPNATRRGNLVADGKKARALADGFRATDARLEMFAGTQYLRVLTEAQWLSILNSCCGATDNNPNGLHYVPNYTEHFPHGVYNFRMCEDRVCGSVHPAAPEWLFNAKREDALQAGLVHFDGSVMNVDPSQINPSSYFTSQGYFRIPDWVGKAEAYHLQTDPNITNIFDAALPYSVRSAEKPGPDLLGLFLEREGQGLEDYPNALLDLFNNKMTGVDQQTMRMIRSVTESIAGFDTMELDENERKALRQATANGIRSYGRSDDDGDILEPAQKLNEVAFQSTLVHRELIVPWAHEKRVEINKLFDEAQDDNDLEYAAQQKEEFQMRFNAVMRDLAELHLARITAAFESKADRATIPIGYRAVYDGLMKELEQMPNGTANLGHVFGFQMMDADRTVFGHITDWINQFFESDCFIEGRDWRVMQELFLHCFGARFHMTCLMVLVHTHILPHVLTQNTPVPCFWPHTHTQAPISNSFCSFGTRAPLDCFAQSNSPTRRCCCCSVAPKATASRCARSACRRSTCPAGFPCRAPPRPRRACRATRMGSTARTASTTR